MNPIDGLAGRVPERLAPVVAHVAGAGRIVEAEVVLLEVGGDGGDGFGRVVVAVDEAEVEK